MSAESSSPSRAVFLSCASQDAEAARRICDTLRAAGVEVGFDADGGLEQGDEWDAKIRKPIKECVLFIPLISANTQARYEGHFRLEWELAAERAMSIAAGVAFILPIIIDATRDARPRRARAGSFSEGAVDASARRRSHARGPAAFRQTLIAPCGRGGG